MARMVFAAPRMRDMSRYCVVPSKLHGEVAAPPSKSQTLRAILFGALAKGTSTIRHYLDSPDTTSMIQACRAFGASIDIFPEVLSITGVGGAIAYTEDVINAGNSGIVLRFCTAVGALSSLPVVITGDHSIRHQRPMKPLLDALRELHVSAESMRGDFFAPIIVKGPLLSGKVVIRGEDSQPISALLIASAFSKEGGVDIEVINPGEKPWVGLTLDWFDRLGIAYSHKDYYQYHIPGNSLPKGFEYTVPGDCSSAAFPIAAALVTGSEITVTNIDMDDPQGDKELFRVFQEMGAQFDIDAKNKSIHVRKSDKPLRGCTVDINNFVDAISVLAVVSCFAEGVTVLTNAAVARNKECNRIQCIQEELRKMGACIEETEDGLRITCSKLTGTRLFSHRDHRMAMSLVVAALGSSEKESIIEKIECVSKTFPSFLHDFKNLGAAIEVEV